MYSHIFASMYQGTMMGRSDLLLVFPCLLAHCDAAGNVDLHPKALASMTGISEDRVRAALAELESDDPESRTSHPQYGGKRIVRIDEHRPWGWFVVNYGKYRELIRAHSIREQNRIRQERKREKDAVTAGHATVTPPSRAVTTESRSVTVGSRKEKEKEKDMFLLEPPEALPPPSDGFDAFWTAWPRKDAKKPAHLAWKRLTPEKRRLAVEGIPAYLAHAKPDFLMLPTTWLNQERWNDKGGNGKSTTPPRDPSEGLRIQAEVRAEADRQMAEAAARQGGKT